MLVGATFPAKKGQVNFGRFYLGNVADYGSQYLLQHLDRRRFRKYGENSQTSKQTGIFNDKTAAQQWVKF